MRFCAATEAAFFKSHDFLTPDFTDAMFATPSQHAAGKRMLYAEGRYLTWGAHISHDFKKLEHVRDAECYWRGKDSVIGHIALFPMDDGAIGISSMCIENRSRGLGSALMHETLSAVDTLMHSRVVRVDGSINPGFYLSLGFVDTGSFIEETLANLSGVIPPHTLNEAGQVLSLPLEEQGHAFVTFLHRHYRETSLWDKIVAAFGKGNPVYVDLANPTSRSLLSQTIGFGRTQGIGPRASARAGQQRVYAAG